MANIRTLALGALVQQALTVSFVHNFPSTVYTSLHQGIPALLGPVRSVFRKYGAIGKAFDVRYLSGRVLADLCRRGDASRAAHQTMAHCR